MPLMSYVFSSLINVVVQKQLPFLIMARSVDFGLLQSIIRLRT